MIINTGCRTDIPAFYAKWLMNRIREGYVLVRNPYNPNQVTKYNLSPEVVDCLAFCTKNPEPMLTYLDELDMYKQYWFVTITPYGKDIEPNVPDKSKVMESFKKLSNHIGVDSIGWRYDPIFIGDGFNVNKHIKCFEKMAEELKGYTHNCTISFLDLYEKVKRNAPDIKPPTKGEQIEIAKAFARIGKENDMVIHACCEKTYLSQYGLQCNGCMSQEIVEKAMLCYQNAIDAYLTLQTGLKGSNKDFINPIAVGNIQAAIDRLNKLSYDNENRIYLYYDFSDIINKYHGRESMDVINKLLLLVGEINQKIESVEPSEFSKQLCEALHDIKIDVFHTWADAINNQVCILTEIGARLRNEYKEYLK